MVTDKEPDIPGHAVLQHGNRVQQERVNPRKGKQETLDCVNTCTYAGVLVVSAVIEMPSFSLQAPEKKDICRRENCNT